MERAERLRRLQELKKNMAVKQGVQDPPDLSSYDPPGVQIVADDRYNPNRNGSANRRRRQVSAKVDNVVYSNNQAAVKGLYQDNSLPAIPSPNQPLMAGAEYSRHQ